MDSSLQFLLEITVILVVAGLTAVLFSKLKMPAIIGYLAAGIIVGPYVFPYQIITDTTTVNSLANLGIVLLMFTIGLEMNLTRLRRTGVFALVAGTIEISLMITIGYGLGILMGWGTTESIFLGGVMSISSTAITVRVLTDAGHIERPYATALVGILIVEDIAAVVILAVVSPLSSGNTPGISDAVSIVVVAVLFIALSLVLGFAIVPRVINYIYKNYSSEVLLLVSLGFCFGMAFISAEMGLSMAIGAFVMGIIVSRSTAQHELVLKATPIKEMFMAIFFVSIGMLIDPRLVVQNIVPAIIIAIVFIVGKVFSVTVGTYLANEDARSSLMSGMAMVAMGEFSFVIAKTGMENGTISDFFYSSIIGAALITMVVMPIVFRYSNRAMDYVACRMPSSVMHSMQRTEALRTDVRSWMAGNKKMRKEVLHQMFWIFLDFVIIYLIQIFAGIFYGFGGLLEPVANWLSLVPNTMGMIVAVALTIPPLIGVMRRLKKIAKILVEGVLESGHYHHVYGRTFFRIIMRLGYIFTFIALFFSLILSAPLAGDFSPFLILVGLIVGIMVWYWLRDINKATHEKMTQLLTENLIDKNDGKRTD